MQQWLKVEIGENETAFSVNGVVLEKRHLAVIFPDTPDMYKALSKYLCLVPFLYIRGEHFTRYHKLGESAAWGVAMAPRLVHALNLTEDAVIPFMLACMEQAEADVSEISKEMQPSYGECNVSEETPASNVISFKQTVH